jgi:hypothetical protein
MLIVWDRLFGTFLEEPDPALAAVRARPGRLRTLTVFFTVNLLSLYGVFVWARGALNGQTAAVSGPSCRCVFGPRSSYYCKMLLVRVLPY